MLLTSMAGLALCYAFLGLYAWFECDRMIFRPHPSRYRDKGGILWIRGRDGARLAAVSRMVAESRYTILYLHGNGEDIADCLPAIDALAARGYSVLCFDYRAYGLTAGRTSERNVYADSETVYRYLVEERNIPPTRILLYGRSVGSGPAVELARRHAVGGLVLQGAFMSAFRVVTRISLLPFDRFCNLAKIGSVRCPLLVIHGTRDEVVPFSHGQALYETAREPKANFWAGNSGHNDILDKDADGYWDALEKFCRQIEKRVR